MSFSVLESYLLRPNIADEMNTNGLILAHCRGIVSTSCPEVSADKQSEYKKKPH